MILATGGEVIQFCVTAGEAQPNLRTSHPIQLSASERSNLLADKQLFDLSEADSVSIFPTTGSTPMGHLTRGYEILDSFAAPYFY